MNTENKTYTAADFAKYHAGTMPAKEMHALEKAALEDDFLADALDGYTHTNKAEEDIADIKEILANKKDTVKVIPIAAAKNNWLKYAAAAVIVLGLGTLFYNVNNKSANNNLAKNEVTPNKIDTSVSNVFADTGNVVVANTDALAKLKSNTQSDITYSEDADASNAVNEPAITIPQRQPAPIILADNSKQNTAAINSIQNGSYNYNQLNNNIFQANVDNNKTGGPKQLANIKNNNGLANNTQNGILNNDDRAKFKTLTQKADSLSIYPIAINRDLADKAIEKDMASPAAKSVAVYDAEAAQKTEEVVVVGYGKAKKRNDVASVNSSVTADALQGKVAGVQITETKKEEVLKLSKANNAATINFNTYVQKNIKPVFDEKGNEIKGTVMLSFKTNKEGEPTKIKIAQSLAKKCNAQAIELLKNSKTLWSVNNKDRIVVEVKF